MSAIALRRVEEETQVPSWSRGLMQPTLDAAACIARPCPHLGYRSRSAGPFSQQILSPAVLRYQLEDPTQGWQDHVVLGPDAVLIINNLDHVPDCPYTLTSSRRIFVAQFRLAGRMTMSSQGRTLAVDHHLCLFNRMAPGDERQVHIAEGPWRGVSLICGEAALARWGLAESVRALLPGGDGAAMTAVSVPAAASEAIRDLLECRYDGALRRPFVEAKLVEALCGVLDAAAHNRATPSAAFSPSELRRVTLAVELIGSAFDEPLTLQLVARRVGLNRSRLAAGVRALFDTTFYERLREVRMVEARRLLDRGGSVSLVAAAVGYESACSFSRAFKARYGVSPSERRTARG